MGGRIGGWRERVRGSAGGREGIKPKALQRIFMM
jgi:hypothetical protein